MKYQLIALPALAATVAGQDLNSILNVLQTALPSSLVAEAITNSAAVESQISSQFAAGETPGWFSSLPTDVQSYLAPTDAAGSSSVSAAASSFVANNISSPITAAPTALGTGTLLNPNGTAAAGNATGMGRNSSMVSTGSLTASESATATGSGSGSTGGAGSGSGSSDSAESSGSSTSDSGASLPTAAFGMGLAGAVGMIGVLAL